MISKRALTNSAAGLGIALAVAGCETKEDIKRKPALVEQFLANAAKTCSPKDDWDDEQPYKDRLRKVLNNAKSLSLDYLKANGITVCLDKRLAQDNRRLWEFSTKGVYYPQQKLLTLWDNGKDTKPSLFSWSAATYGGNFLDEFPDTFGGMFSKFASVKNVDKPIYARTYTRRCGTRCTSRRYEWRGSKRDSDDDNDVGLDPVLPPPPLLKK